MQTMKNPWFRFDYLLIKFEKIILIFLIWNFILKAILKTWIVQMRARLQVENEGRIKNIRYQLRFKRQNEFVDIFAYCSIYLWTFSSFEEGCWLSFTKFEGIVPWTLLLIETLIISSIKLVVFYSEKKWTNYLRGSIAVRHSLLIFWFIFQNSGTKIYFYFFGKQDSTNLGLPFTQ